MAGKKGSSRKEEVDTIIIKRTYNFAGRVVTETKTVARDSAEARLYLATHGDDSEGRDSSGVPPRKIRRAFRSAFEPVSLAPSSAAVAAAGRAGGRRHDLNLGMANLMRMREDAAAKKAKELNTVEKSKLDWAAHVDQEGIRDELELAGRKKGNFTDTQSFLARVEERKDDEERKVRLATKT